VANGGAQRNVRGSLKRIGVGDQQALRLTAAASSLACNARQPQMWDHVSPVWWRPRIRYEATPLPWRLELVREIAGVLAFAALAARSLAAVTVPATGVGRLRSADGAAGRLT